jgi:arylsulfate sulfotransferase
VAAHPNPHLPVFLAVKHIIFIIFIGSLPAWSHVSKRQPSVAPQTITVTALSETTSGSVTVTGQTSGPTPFISLLQATVSPPNALVSAQFTIVPKTGSVTRPISALYTKEYLQSRGYLNTNTGSVTLPVFGLYANYSNTVKLDYIFSDGSSQQSSVNVVTAAFTGGCGQGTPIVLQARTNSTALSYDYFMVKVQCGSNSPMIVDTDGGIRWAGSGVLGSLASMFYDNAIYIAARPPSSSNPTGIGRFELDGSYGFLADYAGMGITSSGHHNIDPGKRGMLTGVDTTTQIESVIMEIDGCGNVLKTWNMANIISAAMTAGGDNPTQFVQSTPNDWFHHNATTYRKSDDSLIVSSRENFVICLDYETGAIKWILGDPTKQWYQFQSLRNYALTLAAGSLPPIGEHSVSITKDDNLLLFDNGQNSQHHTPPGVQRTYSAPRKYQIDTQNRIATEVWNYPNGQSILSAFCSSVYEDDPLNYLVDYAWYGPTGSARAEILGLSATGAKVFDYAYTTTNCAVAWNSIPVHLEHLVFTGPNPVNNPSGWRIASVSPTASNVVVRFPAAAGQPYRLEYKDHLSDPTWQTAGDITPQCGGIAEIADASTTAAGPPRFYRVRLLP